MTTTAAELLHRRVLYIGVDPGVNGGLAAILPNGLLEVERMPKQKDTENGVKIMLGAKTFLYPLFQIVKRWVTMRYDYIKVYIEDVSGYIGSNRDKPHEAKHNLASADRMFTFGYNAGACAMAFYACSLKPEFVRPQQWQKLLGIPYRSKSEDRAAFKKRLWSTAQRLWPDMLGITLNTSDAVLLAEYGRRTYQVRIS